jgi:hypothetical protein
MTMLANTGANMSPRKITTTNPNINNSARMMPWGSEKYFLIQRLIISVIKAKALLASCLGIYCRTRRSNLRPQVKSRGGSGN